MSHWPQGTSRRGRPPRHGSTRNTVQRRRIRRATGMRPGWRPGNSIAGSDPRSTASRSWRGGADRTGMRSIASQSFQPTLPIQRCSVPGRIARRNGLRKPYATISRWGPAEINGLLGSAAPVAGSTRIRLPLRTTGSPAARRALCARSAPPSAAGGCSTPPEPAGGSPHGLAGVGGVGATGVVVPPNCPKSTPLKLAPSPAVAYSAPSARIEDHRPSGSGTAGTSR